MYLPLLEVAIESDSTVGQSSHFCTIAPALSSQMYKFESHPPNQNMLLSVLFYFIDLILSSLTSVRIFSTLLDSSNTLTVQPMSGFSEPRINFEPSSLKSRQQADLPSVNLRVCRHLLEVTCQCLSLPCESIVASTFLALIFSEIGLQARRDMQQQSSSSLQLRVNRILLVLGQTIKTSPRVVPQAIYLASGSTATQ